MIEPTTLAIDKDELTLAQIACAKLAKLTEGALSIGLPALTSGIPEPRTFLEERFRVMGAFALLLHTVSGKPGSIKEILHLRESSSRLLSALDDLQRQLMTHLDSAETLLSRLPSIQEATTALCDAIEHYARLVGLDQSITARLRPALTQVLRSMETLDTLRASSAV